MILTFPHMGRMYITLKGLFDDLGVKTVIPPPVSQRTLEIGTRISPETACLPLKINLGNYIESIAQGADTIVLTGTCGPCRFGYYGVMEQEILRDNGYNADVVILESPTRDPKAFFQRIRKISGNQSWPAIGKSFLQAYGILTQVDELLDLSLRKRPREKNSGETDRALTQFEKQVRSCCGSREILGLIHQYQDIFAGIEEKENGDPLKIGLIGEIYTLIEPYVNLNIGKKLGALGVEVYRGITITDWVRTHLYPDRDYRKQRKEKMERGKEYLGLCIGGHAWETVASAVHYCDMGLDGVIQILPFGCMPEIVAESILPAISRDRDFPVMTLTVDEMTGEAGYLTRLEAFVDLLSQKKERKYEQDGIVSGT